jgi:D-alanine-D-alanine ligase
MQGGKKGGKTGDGKHGAQGYSQLPADLPKTLYDKAVQLGLDVYKTIGCSGTARVDMLINNQTKEVLFNEVNPLPGSLYSHNWSQAGVSSVDLVQRLVGYAEERWQQKQKLATTFSTSYIKQF